MNSQIRDFHSHENLTGQRPHEKSSSQLCATLTRMRLKTPTSTSEPVHVGNSSLANGPGTETGGTGDGDGKDRDDVTVGLSYNCVTAAADDTPSDAPHSTKCIPSFCQGVRG